MGFYEDQIANPIVVHLLVPRGYVSDDEACSLLEQAAATVSVAQWEGEQ
jgi:hypothetical protein